MNYIPKYGCYLVISTFTYTYVIHVKENKRKINSYFEASPLMLCYRESKRAVHSTI